MKNEKLNQQKQLDDIIQNTIKNIKTLIGGNAVIGEKILIEKDTTLLPISKINAGFICGGGEIGKSTKKVDAPFSAGTGAGFNIIPLGFIIIKNGKFKYVHMAELKPYEKFYNLAEKVFNSIVSKGEKND